MLTISLSDFSLSQWVTMREGEHSPHQQVITSVCPCLLSDTVFSLNGKKNSKLRLFGKESGNATDLGFNKADESLIIV